MTLNNYIGIFFDQASALIIYLPSETQNGGKLESHFSARVRRQAQHFVAL